MQLSPSLPIFDRMTAIADSTRSRMLLLLERHELTVNEIRSVLQLPQSTVSRHLKVLADHGWIASRADGTSRRYRGEDRIDSAGRKLWHIVREQIITTSAASHDARRLQTVLSHRRSRSQKFFSSSAGRWDRLRVELFGSRADLLGLLGLLDETWTIGDLGCGTGQLSESLSPFVARVIAIDDSQAMLTAARKRLALAPNVEVRSGRLEALPVEDGSLDAALLFLVMHYIPEPGVALAEARRALKPGGRLLIVDMMPHDREDLIQDMGHVWRGFSSEHIASLLESAGFRAGTYRALPPDEAARGPGLFAAAVRKTETTDRIADTKSEATAFALTA